MSEVCSVYLFGYPHREFGHVVKVGISNNVFARLATIQTHNPDAVIPHFSFDFRSRQIAREVEQDFHRQFSDCGIRGEWFGMAEKQALYMLALIVVRKLSDRYPKEIISQVRHECGLLRAFAILDNCPDEEQEAWADEWMQREEAFA